MILSTEMVVVLLPSEIQGLVQATWVDGSSPIAVATCFIVEVGRVPTDDDHLSKVQNLCWLMISWWIILPNILGIMIFYNDPIEESL